jgi:hypothetical protein
MTPRATDSPLQRTTAAENNTHSLHILLTYISSQHEYVFPLYNITVQQVVIITVVHQAMIGLLTAPRSWDSSVGIATGYNMDDRGSISGMRKRLFSSIQSPNRLRGTSSLLFNRHCSAFSGGKAA